VSTKDSSRFRLKPGAPPPKSTTAAAWKAMAPTAPAASSNAKGAVIIFDELNNDSWPGETRAVIDTMVLKTLRIERFPFEPHISYAVIE
jgi:hypothetical protein